MRTSIRSHIATATVAASGGAVLAYLATTTGAPGVSLVTAAEAQAPQQTQTDVIIQPLADLGREMRIRLTERPPGNGSPPHRHPGHHTFGYILEGTYELKVNDGPVRTLKPGEAFYEPPGALHAVSRNPSSDRPVKYLVIQVADPSKPATVQE